MESVTISSEKGEIFLSINLYGGGFTAIMIPPVKVKIGIPKGQIGESVKLMETLRKEIRKSISGE